jgi:YggT family protein
VTYFNQAGLYLIQLVFGFYILLVLLRLLFQLVRASFYNPISQFIVTLTQPPLQFLRRFIPGLFGIDMAAVVLLLALQILEIYMIAWFQGASPAVGGVVVIAMAQLIEFTVYVFIVAIFIRIILSWVNPYGTRHPVGDLLYSLTEPLLAPARRLIPPMGGLDLSPIAVFVLLQLTLILIVHPLRDFGGGLLVF